MILASVWRTRIAAISASILAVWLGISVANQELLWPVLITGALAALILAVIQPLPLDTLLLGGVLVGYIAGNRGFAQISLAPNLPLLPAEFVLLVAGSFLLMRSVHERVLPVRRELLNGLVLLWIAVSSVRLYADVRAFGVMALRDYATVYYALFFFIGEHAGLVPTSRRFLLRCLTLAFVLLGVIFPLFVRIPDLFVNRLTLRNVPVIYFKGDLAGTFLAAGSILFYLGFETRRSWTALGLSLAFAGGTLMTGNRASMLGLVAAAGLLLLARRWRFAAVQSIGALIAAVVVLLGAYVERQSWHRTPLYGAYERVVSLVDPYGTRTYTAEDAADKGDNNMFRLMWWRTVYDDTIAHGPIAGLGFGYDLAEQFVQEYYPDAGDEFMARSPHNVVLTTFARTGIVGLAPFLAIIVVMLRRTLRQCRADVAEAAPWLICCAIFVSACFGVVLEGPMGAVVFWTLLGLANAAAPVAATEPSVADVPEAALASRE